MLHNFFYECMYCTSCAMAFTHVHVDVESAGRIRTFLSMGKKKEKTAPIEASNFTPRVYGASLENDSQSETSDIDRFV